MFDAGDIKGTCMAGQCHKSGAGNSGGTLPAQVAVSITARPPEPTQCDVPGPLSRPQPSMPKWSPSIDIAATFSTAAVRDHCTAYARATPHGTCM